jgi:hypothetical protein
MPGKPLAEWIGRFSPIAPAIDCSIMAARPVDGNVGIALLGNTITAGAILALLIRIFEPVPGVRMNSALAIARGFANRFCDIHADAIATRPGASCPGVYWKKGLF